MNRHRNGVASVGLSLKSFSLALGLAAASFLSASAVPLRDVPSSHWAKDSVETVVSDYEIMKGYKGGYFGGNRNLTRYELATTMANLMQFYNAEFEADREDLSSLAGIMEQFQEELRVVDSKLTTLNNNLTSINEKLSSQNGELAQRVELNEGDIFTLQQSGFLFDKVTKGSFRDVGHVLRGFKHPPMPPKKWQTFDSEDIQDVSAQIQSHSHSHETHSHAGHDHASHGDLDHEHHLASDAANAQAISQGSSPNNYIEAATDLGYADDAIDSVDGSLYDEILQEIE